jgi:RHS repeat-associated protein
MVNYQYDALGRVSNRAINGVVQATAFDALARVTNVVNALGSFSYDFDGATERPLDAYYPNGQSSHFSYFNNLGDRRLQQIIHQKPNASIISSFSYAYNPVGEITNWVQQLGALTQTRNIGYDAADQLLSVAESGGSPVNYNYGYDAAANRLFENTNSVQSSFGYNSLNQLVSMSDTNAPNLSYQWDAEQRLTGIIQGTNQSEFFYDGLGRRLRILETSGGVTQADRRFVWCGSDICEEWNANNVVVNRFFDQGEQQGGTNLFYVRDHLGSTRELTDSTAAVRAEYAYAPYGSTVKLDGGLEANFGFTGHFRHLPSGLDLTYYRAYDAVKARWISRDPIEENGGINLYDYVVNDPVNKLDIDGELTWDEVVEGAQEVYHIGHTIHKAYERYEVGRKAQEKKSSGDPSCPLKGIKETEDTAVDFAKTTGWRNGAIATAVKTVVDEYVTGPFIRWTGGWNRKLGATRAQTQD